MQKSYFFRQKIECLYKQIAKKSISSLTDLFANGTEKKHRVLHIQTKWLDKSEIEYKPRAFKKEYSSYPFYRTILLDGKPIFKDGSEFLEISFEEFCRRIYQYTSNLNTHKFFEEELEFNYLLAHNITSENDYNIMLWQIVYNEHSAQSNNYILEVHRLEKNKEATYKGKLSIKNQKLILKFYNDTDHITTIFNIELLNSKTDYIVGVAVGISDINQKVPVAKKVVLSKRKPKSSEYKDLYLTLNETESIFAEENTYAFEIEQIDQRQKNFIKYTKKIDKIDSFIDKFTDNYTRTVAHKLASLQLHGLKRLFERLRNNQEFYVFSFYLGLKSILQSFKKLYLEKLYIVMPIYNEDFLFNDFSKSAIETVDMLKSAANDGAKIEIIFVTDSCSIHFGVEFTEHLSSLNSLTNIRFIHKDKLPKKSSSIEFAYTQKRDFIFYKPLRPSKNIYKFSTDNEYIEYLDSVFLHLRHKAIPYAEVQKKREICIAQSKHFIDGLYLYIRSSKQLLELQLQAYSDNTIEILHNNILFARGQIIHHLEQTIILAERINTHTSSTFMLDNYRLKKEAFLGYATAKNNIGDEATFSIAICSRTPIAKEEIEKILTEEHLQLNHQEAERKLNDYLLK